MSRFSNTFSLWVTHEKGAYIFYNNEHTATHAEFHALHNKDVMGYLCSFLVKRKMSCHNLPHLQGC